MIEFKGRADRLTAGYLATPAAGVGPSVVVIQEWWGLNGQIKGVCDRLADAGFTALAPDLYDGRVVPNHEPDEAAKQMMALQLDEAAADLSGAVDELLERSSTSSVGVIGFCMGGGLALVLGARRADVVKAVIPCYGVHPWPEAHPDYGDYHAATQIHTAGQDASFTPEAARDLEKTLSDLGRSVELYIYPDSQHAFFNEDRPEVYDPAASSRLWERSTAFLKAQLA